MGGGSRGEAPPPPIPTAPTRWLYDRNGKATTLQEYAHYERSGRDQFKLIYDNPGLKKGQYLSQEEASRANPRAWLYDDKGKAIKQIFKGGEGPDDTYDAKTYNLGPDSVPYRHWYDIYGVSQQYAPSSTAIPAGFWESASLAPKSPTFKAPVPFSDTNPDMNVQPGQNVDLASAKAQTKKRRSSGSRSLLGSNSDELGDAEGAKTLLGE